MNARRWCLIAILLISAAAVADAAAAPAVGLPDAAAIGEHMRAFVDDAKGAPGVVVGVQDANGRRLYAYGLSGSGRSAIDPAMRFEIGSISKGFNGMLLAEMIGRGEVEADDTLAGLMPGGSRLPAEVGAITLEDLATHQSGLPRLPFDIAMLWRALAGDPYGGSKPEDLFAAVAAQAPGRIAERRGRFEYSNLGSALLGQLLAARAGSPYDALLRERVLAPLGIDDAAFLIGPHPPDLVQGHSRGRPVDSWRLDAYAPAGGLAMTAGDLLDLGERMLAGEPDFVAEAVRPRRGGRIGLGWFHDRFGGHATIWHNGITSGSHSFLAVVPEQGWVVVVLANGDGNARGLGVRLLDPFRPQVREIAWVRLGLTLLGLVGTPLFLLWYAWPGRAIRTGFDRVQALGRMGDAAVVLALLSQLGDWIVLPFPLWWLSVAATAAAAAALAWCVRAAPWLTRGRWRYWHVVYLLVVVAILVWLLA